GHADRDDLRPGRDAARRDAAAAGDDPGDACFVREVVARGTAAELLGCAIRAASLVVRIGAVTTLFDDAVLKVRMRRNAGAEHRNCAAGAVVAERVYRAEADQLSAEADLRFVGNRGHAA